MNDRITPDNVAGPEGKRMPTPDLVPQNSGVKLHRNAGGEIERGSSTYATGGGGVSFEHLVATVYLASMLTGDRRTEARELPVRRVLFQTSPPHPVDDLLVECGDGTSQRALAVACRASPDFVQSDAETVKLVGSLLAEVERFDTDDHHVVVATAGWTEQSKQLAKLCDLARRNADPESLKAAMDVDGRWPKQLRGRFDQFLKMVGKAIQDGTSEQAVLQLAWRLLTRLHVVGFMVQIPDTSGRTAVATSLDGVASTRVNGVTVRDRLEAEVRQYAQTGAVVDIKVLLRDLHGLVDPARTRRRNEAANSHDSEIVPPAVDYPEDVKALAHYYIRRFAGRHVELDRIRRFLADPTPGYLLIEAPSGFGKSALATQVVHRIRNGDWNGQAPNVVFFFVREQRREHTAMAFLAAANSQLMRITGMGQKLPTDPEGLRTQFRTLWQAAIRKDQPLLLVVDGLDEAASGPDPSIIEVLPDHLGPSTHVLVTSRPNPAASEAVSLEHPLRSAQIMTLRHLTLTDISDLLTEIREDLAGFAAPILRATAGEPLFVRSACDGAEYGGAEFVQGLTKIRGTLHDFFRHQFTQLNNTVKNDTANGDLTWRMLALLAIAHGPLTFAELGDVLDKPLSDVDRALRPVLRYLVGRDQFELPHAQLRTAIGDYLGAPRLADADTAIRAWGARYAEESWPDHTPVYLVNRYFMHLDEDRDYSARVALVRPAWLRLTARRTGSYRMFADQMRAIAHSALNQDPVDVVNAAHCGLIQATFRSVAGRLPTGALKTMVRLGRVREAVDYAFLQDDPADRASAFCAIARSISPGAVEMQNALDYAKKAIIDIDIDMHDPEIGYPGVFADLAAALMAAGRQDEAVEIATRLADRFMDAWDRSLENAAVDALAAANMYERLADAASYIANREAEGLFGVDFAKFDAAQIAAGAARAYSLAKDPVKAKVLAHYARNIARQIPVIEESVVGATDGAVITVKHGVESVLKVVAESYAYLGEFPESVEVIEEIPYPWRRGEALVAVAEIAAEANEGAMAADLVIRAVQEFASERNRQVLHRPEEAEFNRLLSRTAALLAETGQAADAAVLLAAIDRRIREHQPSSTFEQFIAEVAAVRARSDQGADVSALLNHLTDPDLRQTTSAECAAALVAAGHHTEGSTIAHRVLAEMRHTSPPSALKQELDCLGPLLRAFTGLGDDEAADQLVDRVSTALQAHPALTIRDMTKLLDLAEQRAGTGHSSIARNFLDFALHAMPETTLSYDYDRQYNMFFFWGRAALVEHALDNRQNTSRYVDRSLAELRSAHSSGALPESIDHARKILRIGLKDDAREILQIVERIHGRTPMYHVGRNADLYIEMLGENWISDRLTSSEFSYRSDYQVQLGLALSWFHLGEYARATEILERFTYIEPKTEWVRLWSEAVCESAHILLRMNQRKAALNAFRVVVERHLAGRVGNVIFDPLPQFHTLLTASVPFLSELPDGSTSLWDFAWAAIEMRKWLSPPTSAT